MDLPRFLGEGCDTGEAAREFHRARPFPHLIRHHCFNPERLKEAVVDIKSIPNKKWRKNQHGKSGFSDVYNWGPIIGNIFNVLMGDYFLQELRLISGIPDLEHDLTLGGAGIHKTANGGSLQIHVDFNCLEYDDRTLYRRLNCFLFLNEDWQQGWGGELELWKGSPVKLQKPIKSVKGLVPIVKIQPRMGTFVMFETSEHSWHGHPVPLTFPDGRERLSFAVYLYTREKPDWFEAKHSTVYKKSKKK